jgi:hypothetical protein
MSRIEPCRASAMIRKGVPAEQRVEVNPRSIERVVFARNLPNRSGRDDRQKRPRISRKRSRQASSADPPRLSHSRSQPQRRNTCRSSPSLLRMRNTVLLTVLLTETPFCQVAARHCRCRSSAGRSFAARLAPIWPTGQLADMNRAREQSRNL